MPIIGCKRQSIVNHIQKLMFEYQLPKNFEIVVQIIMRRLNQKYRSPLLVRYQFVLLGSMSLAILLRIHSAIAVYISPQVQAQSSHLATIQPGVILSQRMSAKEFFDRGLERYDKQDYQGAIADFNQVIQLDPNNAGAYNNRGLARSELGDKKGAIADYNRAIRLQPNDAVAYNNRGLARSELGDRKGGIQDFNRAIQLQPDYAKAYMNRGVVRNELGDQKGAIEDHNRAIQLQPNDAVAYNNRGVTRLNLGDQKGAIEDFDQAIRLKPNYAKAYYNRGNFRFLHLRDAKAAIADYNQAIRFKPDFAEAYINRGLVYGMLGNRKSAIADIQKAADLFQQQGDTENYQKMTQLMEKFR